MSRMSIHRIMSWSVSRLGAAGAALAVVLLAVPPAVDASVVVPADLGELAQDARAIVYGRVVSVDTRQGEGRRVERLVTVEAVNYLKGGLGATFQVRVPGGRFGRYRTIVWGAPDFRAGEEVVLFLGAEPGGVPFVIGLHQGVYRVQMDEAGRRMVRPPLIHAGQPGAVPVTRGDPARRAIPWQDFQARVASALTQPAASREGRR